MKLPSVSCSSCHLSAAGLCDSCADFLCPPCQNTSHAGRQTGSDA